MALSLYIATPQGEAFDAEVETVVLPGVEGDFGVLAGHEAFISALRAGGIEIRQTDGSRRIVWWDQEEYRIQRIDFYDRKDTLLKTLVSHVYRQYQEAFSEAVSPDEDEG